MRGTGYSFLPHTTDAYIEVVGATLEEAMLHNEYDEIIGQLPKDQYKAQLVVRKSLEYTPTGDKHDGGVYKLTAIG